MSGKATCATMLTKVSSALPSICGFPGRLVEEHGQTVFVFVGDGSEIRHFFILEGHDGRRAGFFLPPELSDESVTEALLYAMQVFEEKADRRTYGRKLPMIEVPTKAR